MQTIDQLLLKYVNQMLSGDRGEWGYCYRMGRDFMYNLID